MPGATETEFFKRAKMEDTKVAAGDKDDPADVARIGFTAMMKAKATSSAVGKTNFKARSRT